MQMLNEKSSSKAPILTILAVAFILIAYEFAFKQNRTDEASSKADAAAERSKNAVQPTPEVVTLKDFVPGEIFRKPIKPTGIKYDVLVGCLELESVSSRYPRTIETLCAGAPESQRLPAAYMVFTAKYGAATLRMQE